MQKAPPTPPARALRHRAWALALCVLLGGACTVAGGEVGLLQAAVLGLVEGVTEYLPVSSTGHLAVTADVLWPDAVGARQAALESYLIVIQGGAILAVLVLYRARVAEVVRGIRHPGPGRRLGVALALGLIPAGVAGLALGDLVKERLFGFTPIVAAWIVGGIGILALERWYPDPSGEPLEDLDGKRALLIGAAQAVALWPGTSRSLVTIVAGRLVGLSVVAAVEFSFLLGAVTLLAASIYEGSRSVGGILTEIGLAPAVVGFVVATVSAAAAVRWLVGYLSRRSLAVFGWYRIAIGILVLVVFVL